MPFHFSLRAVLMLREIVEQRELRRLESLHRDIAGVEHELTENQQMSALARERRGRELDRGIAAVQLDAYYDEERKLDEHIHVLGEKLKDLRMKQIKQLKTYQLACSEREVLEDIRERHLQAYRRAQVQKEQKTLDDIFLARRKGRE